MRVKDATTKLLKNDLLYCHLDQYESWQNNLSKKTLWRAATHPKCGPCVFKSPCVRVLEAKGD